MNRRAFAYQRPLAAAAPAFLAGLLAGTRLTGVFLSLPAAGLLLSAAVLFAIRKNRAQAVVVCCFVFFFFGALRTGAENLIPLPPAGKMTITATVMGEVKTRGDGSRQGRLKDLVLADEAGGQTRLAGAYWTYRPQKQTPSALYDGQRVRMEATIYHPKGQTNPFGFHFRHYLLARGMRVGVSGARELQLVGEVRTAHQNPLLRFKHHIEERLDALLPCRSGLAKALLTGDRSDLSPEIVPDFRALGISHVLAVSGLHVGIVSLILIKILQGSGLSLRARSLVTALFLLFYAALLDFQPSVVRACLMMGLYLGAGVCCRRRDGLSFLAFACLCQTLVRPYLVFDLGFQLSFLAVFGLVVVYDRLRASLRRLRAFRRPLAGVGMKALEAYGATLAAVLCTLGVVINNFYEVGWLGLLVSPPVVLMTGLLIWLYLLLLLLSCLYAPAAALFSGVAVAATQAFEKITHAAAAWGKPLALPALPTSVTVGFLLLLWLWSRYVVLPRRHRVVLSLAVAGAMALSAVPFGPSGVVYTQFDVGAADAAVVEDGGKTLVVDTGEDGQAVLRYLRAKGKKIDALFLSHLHRDHAGGVETLLDGGLAIGCLYMPVSVREMGLPLPDGVLRARDMGVPIRYLAAGDMLRFEKTTVSVVWPQRGKTYQGVEENDASMALYLDLDGVTLLSMGDVSRNYERYALRPADVLKAAHHGSKTGTGEDFLSAVSPQAVFISQSAAYRGRAQALTERLQKRGIAVFITHAGGAVQMRVQSGTMRTQAWNGEGVHDR